MFNCETMFFEPNARISGKKLLLPTPHIVNVGLSKLLIIVFQGLLSASWTTYRPEVRHCPYAKTL